MGSGLDVAGDVVVSPGLPTVMGADGFSGGERDLRRVPRPAGRSPIGRVLPIGGFAAIVASAFVTVVTWPGR
jgi:hypothetical protein